MPRTLAETMRLRGPFGGLMSARAKRQINPLDCLDSLNIHTVYGDIRRRPGFDLFRSEPASTEGYARALTSVRIQDERYLYAWWELEDGGRHTLLDENGEGVFSFDHGPARIPTVAQAMGRVYTASGSNSAGYIRKLYKGRKEDGSFGLVSHRVGVEEDMELDDEPAYAMDGTLPTDWYSYYITWYNERADVESAAGPEIRIELSGPPATRGCHIKHPTSGPLDSQITHWRIYRMREEVDPIHHRVATVDRGLDYYEDVDVEEIDLSFEGELIKDRWSAPSSYVLAWHVRRMWWVPVSNQTLVRWSELDQPERVNPVNSMAIGIGETDTTRALYSAFGRLYVFKESSIWVIVGSEPETFVRRCLTRDAGCPAPQSIVSIGNAIYFVDQNGAYRIVGDRVEFLSADIIDKEWSDFGRSWLYLASGMHHRALGLYIISGLIAREPEGDVYQQLAYDYRKHKWHRWQIPGAAVFLNHRSVTNHNEYQLFSITDHTDLWTWQRRRIGRLYERLGDWADTGPDGQEAPIPWSWTTGDLDFGIERPKKVFYASVLYEGADRSGDTVSVEYMHNSDGAYHPLGTLEVEPGSHMKKLRIARLADSVRFRLSGSSLGRDSLTGLDIAATAIGHR